jgi:hypothetical protein
MYFLPAKSFRGIETGIFSYRITDIKEYYTFFLITKGFMKMGALFFLGFFWVILRMCLAILTKGVGGLVRSSTEHRLALWVGSDVGGSLGD